MNKHQIDSHILERAIEWTKAPFDNRTREEVVEMIQNNPVELKESFYRNLEFGTGGLRGIMGVGTNRMNKYTVAMATQGLANYIKKMFDGEKLRVAIAYDSRNNSREFAQITAEVMSANSIEVYLFDSLRPTPELSFAIRELKCHSGIVITASHNPKEYNGYKAYWNDGGQLISPHDKNVIAEVEKITNPSLVHFDKKPEFIHILGEDFDTIYLSKIASLSLSPEIIKKQAHLPIVYTPIHGTGYKLVPQVLKKFGFENVFTVEQQMVIDGNFPTVVSPNPEEPAALELAIKKAHEVDAELVMATDPDADRVGIAVKNDIGEFILLNGNQTASILIYYLLRRWSELNKLTGNEYIVKTIVTTELLKDIASQYDVACYDVLTGFKFIADIILKNEGKKTFIAGGEESYGYLISDFVRDKDAVMSCAMIAETAAWAKEQGKTLYQILLEIYREFGVYKEHLISLTKKGISGVEEIKDMMENFRKNPPKEIAGSKLVEIRDYKEQIATDLASGKQTKIDLPKSDVLQFFTEDGSKISVRPSGTEPKIKFYFGVKASLDNKEANTVLSELDKKIIAIINSLNIA
ncbi:MAG: phospho-sugar mutase [Lentimicrobiaceae bacterium]|jgi:phosphoglucomutase|nr:phospho-sugar mutase [Lentimicrobiaceae bacterium]